MDVSSPELYDTANIFLSLIEHELNILFGASQTISFIFASTMKDIY